MRRSRIAPLVVLLALGFAACSSSGSSKTSPAESTTSSSNPDASASPRFVSLTGPPSPVLCTAPTSVELHWETRGASKVELRINGSQVFATYPGGRNDHLVPLTCDGRSQTYQLTALGSGGRTTVKTLTLTERVPAT